MQSAPAPTSRRHRPDVEKIGQAAGARVVVAAVFVGEQKSGI